MNTIVDWFDQPTSLASAGYAGFEVSNDNCTLCGTSFLWHIKVYHVGNI